MSLLRRSSAVWGVLFLRGLAGLTLPCTLATSSIRSGLIQVKPAPFEAAATILSPRVWPARLVWPALARASCPSRGATQRHTHDAPRPSTVHRHVIAAERTPPRSYRHRDKGSMRINANQVNECRYSNAICSAMALRNMAGCTVCWDMTGD